MAIWTQRGGGLLAAVLLLAACGAGPVVRTPPITPGPSASSAPTGPSFDFGDAPDPGFPTRLASNGARTSDIGQFWLGDLASPSATLETEAELIDRDALDDGLESVVATDSSFDLRFRLVKASSAVAGPVYFNLLVDRAGDGRWDPSDWVIQNQRVDLAPGASSTIETGTGSVALGRDIWIRAALTERMVPSATDGWDGSGTFVQGEVEDYRLRLAGFPPFEPPPTPTPYAPPTPSPTPSSGPGTTPGSSPSAAPTFVVTGDFVVVCDPALVIIEHGGSVGVHLRLTSGEPTPPDRFGVTLGSVSAQVGGQTLTGQGQVSPTPAAVGGWSAWGPEAGFTYQSPLVDPPERTETAIVGIVLQSRSTTRFLFCPIQIHHGAPSPTATATSIPTKLPALTLSPAHLHAGQQLSFSGAHFTPGGQVTLLLRGGLASSTSQVSADHQGSISGSLAIPITLPPGTYYLTAIDAASKASVATAFTIQ